MENKLQKEKLSKEYINYHAIKLLLEEEKNLIDIQEHIKVLYKKMDMTINNIEIINFKLQG